MDLPPGFNLDNSGFAVNEKGYTLVYIHGFLAEPPIGPGDVPIAATSVYFGPDQNNHSSLFLKSWRPMPKLKAEALAAFKAVKIMKELERKKLKIRTSSMEMISAIEEIREKGGEIIIPPDRMCPPMGIIVSPKKYDSDIASLQNLMLLSRKMKVKYEYVDESSAVSNDHWLMKVIHMCEDAFIAHKCNQERLLQERLDCLPPDYQAANPLSDEAISQLSYQTSELSTYSYDYPQEQERIRTTPQKSASYRTPPKKNSDPEYEDSFGSSQRSGRRISPRYKGSALSPKYANISPGSQLDSQGFITSTYGDGSVLQERVNLIAGEAEIQYAQAGSLDPEFVDAFEEDDEPFVRGKFSSLRQRYYMKEDVQNSEFARRYSEGATPPKLNSSSSNSPQDQGCYSSFKKDILSPLKTTFGSKNIYKKFSPNKRSRENKEKFIRSLKESEEAARKVSLQSNNAPRTLAEVPNRPTFSIEEQNRMRSPREDCVFPAPNVTILRTSGDSVFLVEHGRFEASPPPEDVPSPLSVMVPNNQLGAIPKHPKRDQKK